MTHTTYDGLPVAAEAPFGAAIVVYRRAATGLEFLVLHRAHDGPAFEGDWAWTPPAGARRPDEDPDACAKRELYEETKLDLPLQLTTHGSADWLVYMAHAPTDALVVLDAEHDRFEWVTADPAARLCRPDRVSAQLRAVAASLGA
ncbi:MAG TPA: NUDIX domain-containing protein [Caulobacteraceae bacterium]|jgi:8-oxo-dGTP pyrophosphatase MutT (NUDIX family)|nr:NUDIX domain-containing protein [Caulobacteraceae bacterium]